MQYSAISKSPFIDGTNVQYAYDSTSLGWLKDCPRKYYYSMICGYKPKAEAVNIKFGRLYHTGLETYDRLRADGASHDDALCEAVHVLMRLTWEDGKPWISDHSSKTRETLIRSVIWYCEHFEEDPAQTIILSNGKPAIELAFQLELDFGVELNGQSTSYTLCGYIDRLVQYAANPYVTDRKTTASTLSSNYFDQYDPDNQMSLYSFAAQAVYKVPVKGVIIDGAQIAVGFTRFARGFTYRTDNQLQEWLVDLRYWFKLQEQFAKADYWPMNDKSCHKYGGCHFRKVCSKSPEVRQVFLNSDFVKSVWNPLEPR